MNETDVSQIRGTGRRVSPGLILIALFTVASIVLGIGLVLTSSLGGQPALPLPSRSTDTRAGDPAPDFQRQTLDGATVRLSDYRGRLVFVNFWATWCGPCRQEMPAFQAFQDAQGPDGAVVLSIDAGEAPDAIHAFLDEIGVDNVHILLDPDMGLRDSYTVYNLPTTYVIDASGIIRGIKLGQMSESDLNDYLQAFGA